MDTKVSPEKKKAIVKFLDKKAGGLISAMNNDIKDSFDKMSEYVELTVKRAITGSEIKTDVNFSEEVAKLQSKLKEINYIGYYIQQIVEEGRIKDSYWKNENTYAYKSFMEIVKSYKSEDI